MKNMLLSGSFWFQHLFQFLCDNFHSIEGFDPSTLFYMFKWTLLKCFRVTQWSLYVVWFKQQKLWGRWDVWGLHNSGGEFNNFLNICRSQDQQAYGLLAQVDWNSDTFCPLDFEVVFSIKFLKVITGLFWDSSQMSVHERVRYGRKCRGYLNLNLISANL